MITNHIARSVGPEVQARINALKIGQKMQDLPEHLWHKSFKFYLKEDPTRRGGPNMRIIRLDPSQPSLTVTGYVFNKFVHPYENRFITVREAARLQGFPDDLVFQGSLTSTQLQVGNAVPVALSKAIFTKLLESASYSGLNKLTSLSLFSGAGGMDIGAINAYHPQCYVEVNLSLDIWNEACKTLQGFIGTHTNVVNTDISYIINPVDFWFEKTGLSELPDIIFGGPPCQAFSQAGKQRGIEDERGSMIFEFIRFVEIIKPKYFIMENVLNIKAIHDGKLFYQIINQFKKIGYKVDVDTLLAANFGAPQLRHRVFFIGSFNGINPIKFPEPTHGDNNGLFPLQPFFTVGQAFEGLPKARFSNESMEIGGSKHIVESISP